MTAEEPPPFGHNKRSMLPHPTRPPSGSLACRLREGGSAGGWPFCSTLRGSSIVKDRSGVVVMEALTYVRPNTVRRL
ncbi:MAG: hypothetical protein ACK53Y_00110 [bacterium]